MLSLMAITVLLRSKYITIPFLEDWLNLKENFLTLSFLCESVGNIYEECLIE